ncbi:MAG: gamma-glutamyltransferase [Marinicaulis sp.]|nr:gamma-glutamyltransferase [Marinicaulis sp.]NNL87812.1 gamma-glutamyltransferase [Marinicaulis sp.]
MITQKLFFGALVSLTILAPATARTEAYAVPPLADVVHHPNAGREGMVAAEEKIAAQVGAEILAKGGNAVDAAVASAFAMAVTYPRAGNIGGGGFMLVHLADENKTVAIDYRESAPAAASADMYLDENGDVVPGAATTTLLAAGVPGTVAGLLYALENYGTMSRREVIAPAIRLGAKGYPMTYFLAAMIEDYREELSKDEAAFAELFKPNGAGYLPGEIHKRPDLARTLKKIAKKGRAGFYAGDVAEAIADAMAANDGLITMDDLADYKVIEREPVRGTYRGYEVVSMPPPSSGGVHLIQMLNMLETRPPHRSAGDSAEYLHFLAEVMRRAYADRAEHLGDIDFVDVPVEGLISKNYAVSLASTIGTRAGKSSAIGAGDPPAEESPETTQISVIDKDGNMVSNTYTINLSFGSRIVVPGTGIFLNNEMDDFSAKPGFANSYGLIGNEKNAIAPGKRPLSSMTPALVFKDGNPMMATGAPGGARIITAVLNVILNVIDREMNIGDATDQPRIHHQWLPDVILYEPGLSDDTKALLEAKGHELIPFNWLARPQTVRVRDGWYYGYTDERQPAGGACSADGGC